MVNSDILYRISASLPKKNAYDTVMHLFLVTWSFHKGKLNDSISFYCLIAIFYDTSDGLKSDI